MHNIAQCTSEHEPTRRLSAGRLGWWGGAGQPIIGSSSSLALHTCAISQRSLLRQPHRPCPCLRHHQVHVWQEVHVNHLQLANLSWRHCHQHFWDHLVLNLDRSPMIGSPPFLLWALPFFFSFLFLLLFEGKITRINISKKILMGRKTRSGPDSGNLRKVLEPTFS